jgi:hypothetical protein
VATLVARNVNDAIVAPMWDSTESGVRQWVLCWSVWQKESGFSRGKDRFIFNIIYEVFLYT